MTGRAPGKDRDGYGFEFGFVSVTTAQVESRRKDRAR